MPTWEAGWRHNCVHVVGACQRRGCVQGSQRLVSSKQASLVGAAVAFTAWNPCRKSGSGRSEPKTCVPISCSSSCDLLRRLVAAFIVLLLLLQLCARHAGHEHSGAAAQDFLLLLIAALGQLPASGSTRHTGCEPSAQSGPQGHQASELVPWGSAKPLNPPCGAQGSSSAWVWGSRAAC